MGWARDVVARGFQSDVVTTWAIEDTEEVMVRPCYNLSGKNMV